MKTKNEAANKTSHTPGPWNAHTITGFWQDNPLPITASNPFNGCGMEVALVQKCGQKHANARLIAAAPELLSALRKLLNRVAYDTPGVEVEEARAAILRATEGK